MTILESMLHVGTPGFADNAQSMEAQFSLIGLGHGFLRQI